MFIFYPDVWIITQLHCSQWLLSIRAVHDMKFLIEVIILLIMTSDHGVCLEEQLNNGCNYHTYVERLVVVVEK